MKSYAYWITAASLAGSLWLPTAVMAQAGAAPAATGAAAVASVEVTAKVTKINHKTRAVTLKAPDGSETSFIADAAVKNLDQVKKGDVVIATYTEAMAYDVRKSGKTGAESTVAAATAPLGEKPAGAVVQNTTVTVKITAINAKAPSVTFKGPDGTRQTVKLASAEKLQGVKVGDLVDIGYSEAIAIRVEKAAKK